MFDDELELSRFEKELLRELDLYYLANTVTFEADNKRYSYIVVDNNLDDTTELNKVMARKYIETAFNKNKVASIYHVIYSSFDHPNNCSN